jgi:hypothetical protein
MTPTLIVALAWTGLILAAIPALLTIANLPLFARAARPAAETVAASGNDGPPRVSVLVPARNEEAGIGRLLDAVLASRGVEVEVVVLDDSSDDGTAAIVAARAAADDRVRLVAGIPLPGGWCGKQHACWQAAQAARHDLWVFCDVDVQPEPDAIARSVAELETRGAALVSGFPRQETGSFLEGLLLPLIHFILLGYLPLSRARQVPAASLAAGCGQWFVTRRADYERAGGHAVIRGSLHDGVTLPRAYRRAGLVTDIFDAGDIVSCRMYRGAAATWQGLSKNATEGIAGRATILPFTLLLAGGQVMPVLLFAWGWLRGWQGWPPGATVVAGVAVLLVYLPRILGMARFGQSFWTAAVHPLGVAVFLVLQWLALVRKSLGLETTWRGRRLAPQ